MRPGGRRPPPHSLVQVVLVEDALVEAGPEAHVVHVPLLHVDTAAKLASRDGLVLADQGLEEVRRLDRNGTADACHVEVRADVAPQARQPEPGAWHAKARARGCPGERSPGRLPGTAKAGRDRGRPNRHRALNAPVSRAHRDGRTPAGRTPWRWDGGTRHGTQFDRWPGGTSPRSALRVAFVHPLTHRTARSQTCAMCASVHRTAPPYTGLPRTGASRRRAARARRAGCAPPAHGHRASACDNAMR